MRIRETRRIQGMIFHMKIQTRSNVIDSVIFAIATIGTIMGVYCVYGLYTNANGFVKLSTVVLFLILCGCVMLWSVSKSQQLP
jgi:hypothetical protein